MAISTPTITPEGSIGPITGPITELTGTINPNLGNLWKEDFTISAYQNKYLDAIGVQRLWKRTLEEIHASINGASAKIFRANFSYDQVNDKEEPYLILSSNDDEDNAIIGWLLDADKDVMIEASIDEGDPERHYLYSSTEDNGVVTKFWLSISDCYISFIKVIGNTNSLTLTQYVHEYRDINGQALSSYLRKTTVNTTQNTVSFGRGNNRENSLIISVDNTTGKLTFQDSSNNSIEFTSAPNAVTVADASEVLSSDYIIVGNGNKTIKDSSYKVLSSTGNITAGDGINLPTAGSVANYVTTAIENATGTLEAIAEGKTKAYVIYAGENNSKFKELTASITIGNDVNLVLANSNGTKTVSVGSLKIGDIVYLVDSNYPDRWVGQTGSSGATLYAIDAKTDLSGYQTKLAKTGDLDKPIYVSAAGTISECTKYAGGTSINLNGVNEAGQAVTFYAPTSLGNAGSILKVNSDKTGFTYDTDCNPTSHATTGLTYGGATDTLYGHVKLVKGDVDSYVKTNGETAGKALAADAYHTHSSYIRKTVSSGTYEKTISDVHDSFTITIKNNNANQTVFKQAENYFNLWVKGQDSKPSQDWKFLSSGAIIRTANSTTYVVIDSSMALTKDEIDTILANTTTD